MPRYTRKSAILAAKEATVGVDAAPTGAANALLVSNQSINPLNATNVDRDNVRAYFGGSEQLVGTAYKEVSFDIELAGSGTAGTAPPWGALLCACGFAETTAATPARIEYTPITDNVPSVTIYYFMDGVLHKLLGARGNCEISAGIGEIPKLKFTFQGIDGGDTVAATPATTLSAFKTPVVINDANSGDVTLGGTLAAGAVTGGQPYPGKGLSLSLGNEVQFVPLTSGEGIDLTGRAVSGKVSLDLKPAQYVAAMADVKANVVSALSYQFGTQAGNIVLLFGPSVQRLSPSYEDYNGRAMASYDLRFVPKNGNDELRLILL